MESLSRRDFAGIVPALLAIAGMRPAAAEGQSPASPGATGLHPLKKLTSGVFKPQPSKGMRNGHESHPFLNGMLKAGNIRLEMHESVQQPGAPHETVGTHKHSGIWLVQRGVGTLYLNGVEHKMEAGDVWDLLRRRRTLDRKLGRYRTCLFCSDRRAAGVTLVSHGRLRLQIETPRWITGAFLCCKSCIEAT